MTYFSRAHPPTCPTRYLLPERSPQVVSRIYDFAEAKPKFGMTA
jgi:hypothetical protein